jgi:hypothetical protein
MPAAAPETVSQFGIRRKRQSKTPAQIATSTAGIAGPAWNVVNADDLGEAVLSSQRSVSPVFVTGQKHSRSSNPENQLPGEPRTPYDSKPELLCKLSSPLISSLYRMYFRAFGAGTQDQLVSVGGHPEGRKMARLPGPRIPVFQRFTAGRPRPRCALRLPSSRYRLGREPAAAARELS